MFPFKEGLYYIHCFSLVSTHSTIPAFLFRFVQYVNELLCKGTNNFLKNQVFLQIFFIFFNLFSKIKNKMLWVGACPSTKATWTITVISNWGIIDFNPNATWTYHNILVGVIGFEPMTQSPHSQIIK